MRILIIKPSSFGDIVHALLVVDRIRSQLEVARIHWVARDVFAPLVEASGLADRILRFERSPGGFLRVLREIRQETYDVVLDMQGLARSGWMTFAARAKIKIGRFDAREGSRLFYKVRVPPPPGPAPHHAVEILRQFQRALGLYDLAPETLGFPDAVPAQPLPPGSILLFPESRRAEKEWPGFADLAAALRKSHPQRRIGWCGTGGGSPRGGGGLPEGVADLRGKVPLAALPAVMREAALVVANDSGPVHLAAALGRPLAAVYGPTDPARFGPWPADRPGNAVLRAPGGDLRRLEAAEVVRALPDLASSGNSCQAGADRVR